MSRYRSLAPYYDAFMRESEMDYAAWADYYERVFARWELHPQLILDLACGTGTLTHLMAARGYEMIGVDASVEMLMAAQAKGGAGTPPLFLNQRMEELDLYGTVQAALCSLDGVNYLHPDVLDRALGRVALFLEPGGLFIFDINTIEKFQKLDGETFVSETGDAFCVWRSAYEAQTRRNQFLMDIFTREGARWRRTQEEHIEHGHTRQELCERLRRAGFASVSCFAPLCFDEPGAEEERVFFVAQR